MENSAESASNRFVAILFAGAYHLVDSPITPLLGEKWKRRGYVFWLGERPIMAEDNVFSNGAEGENRTRTSEETGF